MIAAFDGYDFSRKFRVLCDRRPSPEFRPVSYSVEGADGETFVDTSIGPREFQITLVAFASDSRGLHDAARELMDVLAVRAPRKFTFSDEKDPSGTQLYRMAVPDGAFDMEEFMRAGRWTVKFVQHDPFRYGKKRTAVIPGVYQYITVDAGGNQPTPFTAVAYPTGGIYVVRARPAADTDDSRAEEVAYEADFNGRDKLTVNTQALKVSKQNSKSTDSGLRVESRFFMLEGKMSVTANCKTTLGWTERWL